MIFDIGRKRSFSNLVYDVKKLLSTFGELYDTSVLRELEDDGSESGLIRVRTRKIYPCSGFEFFSWIDETFPSGICQLFMEKDFAGF